MRAVVSMVLKTLDRGFCRGIGRESDDSSGDLLSEVSELLIDRYFKEIIAGIRTERELNEFLARAIGGESNKVVNGVEVDVLKGDCSIEVKLDPQRFYEGFEQALAMRCVAGMRKVGVLHVYTEGVGPETIRRVEKMAAASGIPALVFDVRRGEVHELR